MGWFRGRPAYDRARILERATRAARRKRGGQRRKAIALFREVLRREPGNPDIERKVAALLAADGQGAEARAGYQRAIDRLVERGFVEQAIGVCREGAGLIPREVALWRTLALLEEGRGRRGDAVQALLQGRSQLRGPSGRRQALELLREARRIDPTHFAANFELARLLGRTGSRTQAIRILDKLLIAHPDRARRIRWLQFRLLPSVRRGWRWLRAATRRRDVGPAGLSRAAKA